MKTTLLTTLFVLIFFPFQKASAQGLLMDNCANGPTAPAYQAYMMAAPLASSNGLSCETVHALSDTVSVVNLALLPAVAFVKNPAISASLAADLAAAGMTFANPVVLGVTIVGSVGIATFYVVLRQSREDCEQQEREALKQEILSELEARYGTTAGPNVKLEIKK
jgi:hypothetical protein